jgi:hypothetical protein
MSDGHPRHQVRLPIIGKDADVRPVAGPAQCQGQGDDGRADADQ